MIWSRWVEDTIYTIFYKYDLQGCNKQQENLKKICLNELNAHESIKDEIKTKEQLEYFIMQMLLEKAKF